MSLCYGILLNLCLFLLRLYANLAFFLANCHDVYLSGKTKSGVYDMGTPWISTNSSQNTQLVLGTQMLTIGWGWTLSIT